MEEVHRQAAEWSRLRELHPTIPMVLAGDFNQVRDGRPWAYGTIASRATLTDGLRCAGLRSLTDLDLVECGDISHRSHVEHI